MDEHEEKPDAVTAFANLRKVVGDVWDDIDVEEYVRELRKGEPLKHCPECGSLRCRVVDGPLGPHWSCSEFFFLANV